MVDELNGATAPRLTETLRQLLDSEDREVARAAGRAALGRLEAAEKEAEIARQVEERLAAKAAEEVAVPRRSTMSALAKSQYIRARIASGRSSAEAQADYMGLPWA